MEHFKTESEIKQYFEYKGKKLKRVSFVSGDFKRVDWYCYNGGWQHIKNRNEMEEYYNKWVR